MTPLALWIVLVYILLANSEDAVCENKKPSYIQRKDTADPLSYSTKRTKSYCDRVLIGWPQKTADPSFQFHEYKAMTDRFIDYSDHDLVFGLFTYDKMKILAVTFNVGKFVDDAFYKNQEEWDTIICDLQSDVTSKEWQTVDIFFFGFQEADYPFDTTFLYDALRRSFVTIPTKTQFPSLWTEVIEHDGSGKMGNRNTYSYILYNKNKIHHAHDPQATIKIALKQGSDGEDGAFKKMKNWAKEKILKTKTAVIVGTFHRQTAYGGDQFPAGRSKVSGKGIVLANTHLPVDTKNKQDWGVEIRLEGMREIRKQFEQRFVGKGEESKNVPLVLIGDLNFRVIDSDNDKPFEQLTKFMAESKANNDEFWHELDALYDPDPKKSKFLPTCKRIEGSWLKQVEGKKDEPEKKGLRKLLLN